MTHMDTDLLAELIQKKQACLTHLRDMGRKQFELVCEGSITGVLDVLSLKQDVLSRLQSIERALDPFRGQDPLGRQWNSPQQRLQCAERLQQCETLLAEILAQDKQSEQEMTRRRDATAQQLQRIHHAGQTRGAYTAPTAQQGRRLDLSSEA